MYLYKNLERSLKLKINHCRKIMCKLDKECKKLCKIYLKQLRKKIKILDEIRKKGHKKSSKRLLKNKILKDPLEN